MPNQLDKNEHSSNVLNKTCHLTKIIVLDASVCLCRDMKHAGSLERMKEVLELPEVDLRATLASWEDLIKGLWLAKFGVLDRWLLMGGGGIWDVVTHVGLTILLQ